MSNHYDAHGFLLQPSPQWLPYFGNQRRFVPYVLELLEGLGADPGDTFFETNAGSHAISWHANKSMGLRTTANDLGLYSASIGRALSDPSTGASLLLAARGAALIEEFGYQPPMDAQPNGALVDKWGEFLMAESRSNPNREDALVTRGNLFEVIRHVGEGGDFVYCDFAWPWKDGSATEEYTVTSDSLSLLLGDEDAPDFRVVSGRRILNDVVEYLDLAVERFKWVILSNQSSNYPTPEVLEPHMAAAGHVPVISRRLTVPAEYVDDLGKEPAFTEYQYVFEGHVR